MRRRLDEDDFDVETAVYGTALVALIVVHMWTRWRRR